MTDSTFPGGTSVSFLDVYDDMAPDGLHGGSPHVHLTSTECYVVISGQGRLQTIDRSGFRETILEAGSVVWFTPGTVHRAVNDGGLRAIVVMSNAGLPEAGDAVLTFPDDVVASATAYHAAVTLPDASDAIRREAATRRRDHAVRGFLTLRAAAERGDRRPLQEFYTAATALVRDRAATWDRVVRSHAYRQAEGALAMIADISRGHWSFLDDGAVRHAAVSGDRVLGMCGRLRKFDTDQPVADGTPASSPVQNAIGQLLHNEDPAL